MNIFIGAGRLTHDVETRFLPNGTMVARFTIAISRPKSANGDKVTDFISCTAWNKTADLMEKYFHKGSGIMLEGQLNIDQVTAEDGTRKQYTKINVSKVYFPLTRPEDQTDKPDEPHQPEAQVVDDTDDLPFTN